MDDERPTRRESDQRIEQLAADVRSTREEVRSIRDMLISEPEASPLGRALLRYAADNRAMIIKNHEEFRAFRREDFEPIEDWKNQTAGAWRAVLGAAVVLGALGAFFGIASWFGLGPS